MWVSLLFKGAPPYWRFSLSFLVEKVELL